MESPIERAIAAAGGLSELARRIGGDVKAQHVNNWRHRQIPADRCPAIERATEGAVTCEEMRPDVDWGYLRNSGEAEARP